MKPFFESKTVLKIKKEDDPSYYLSSIREVRDDSILIDIPNLNGRAPLLLAPGDRVKVRITRKSGCYNFISRVIDAHQNALGYLISIPKDWECVQRREMFRLEVIFDVKCYYGSEVFDAQAIDISGSGMRIISKRKLNVGEEIRLYLTLHKEKYNLNARVMWVSPKTMDRETLYFVGLQFIDISWKRQDALVAEIFKMQVERRQ